MTDRETLLATVLANPSDYMARLVLADLLRESDDPDTQARGRFLWAGVTAAGFREHELIDDPLYYTAQEEINAVAVAGYPVLWLSALGLGPQPLTVGNWAWDCTLDRVTVRIGATVGTFSRGMLSELTVTLADWYVVGPVALASWPLEGADVTDVPGLTFAIALTDSGWRLTARVKVPGWRLPLLGGSGLPAAVAPRPFLIEESADWRVQERFPNREALVSGMTSASKQLVDDLHQVAGDRWPSSPTQRK